MANLSCLKRVHLSAFDSRNVHRQNTHFLQSVDISPLKDKITTRVVWEAPVVKQHGNRSFVLAPSYISLKWGNCGRKCNKRTVIRASSTSVGEATQDGLLRLARAFLSSKELQIAIGAAITVVCAVANKVLYKMALVPLKNYPLFLALINTFGYVLVYFSILYMRYQAGIVTDEMLEIPKTHFILVGALEALGVASGMAAAAVLPGASISVLLQTFLVWQLALSTVFLKRRYNMGQIVGCAMVLTGVIIALTGSSSGSSTVQISHFPSLLMILSCALQASSTIIKESIFRNASQHLKGGNVDLFVVNSFGSAFQALFVLLMLPFLSQLRGVPFSHLRGYLTEGAGCLFNVGSMGTECAGAASLTALYVIVNLCFNISLLSLLKRSSAVVSSLCTTLAVPFSIFIFTFPLPYVGAPASLHPQFLIGTAVLLSGLAFYNISCNCTKSGKELYNVGGK